MIKNAIHLQIYVFDTNIIIMQKINKTVVRKPCDVHVKKTTTKKAHALRNVC